MKLNIIRKNIQTKMYGRLSDQLKVKFESYVFNMHDTFWSSNIPVSEELKYNFLMDMYRIKDHIKFCINPQINLIFLRDLKNKVNL